MGRMCFKNHRRPVDSVSSGDMKDQRRDVRLNEGIEGGHA